MFILTERGSCFEVNSRAGLGCVTEGNVCFIRGDESFTPVFHNSCMTNKLEGVPGWPGICRTARLPSLKERSNEASSKVTRIRAK